MQGKVKELSKVEGVLEKLNEKFTAEGEAHAEAQKHFHAVSAGLSKNVDGEDASLNDQLMGENELVNL